MWNLLVRAGGNYSIPGSDYFEGISSGVGFEGDLIIPVSREYAIRLHFSRSGLKVEDDFRLIYIYDPLIQILDYDADRYIASFQWNILGSDAESKKTIPFMYTGLGLLHESATFNAIVYDSEEDQTYQLSDDYSETRFLMSIGGGLMYKLSSRLALDGTFAMDLIWVEVYNDEGDKYPSPHAYIIDFKLGLVFFI